jgi:carbonic anhydrase/acetyltransferase-like protein (isoleucine patch superfamily)
MCPVSEIFQPILGRGVYIAPTAYVGGEVAIGDETTIMHHVVIRGDIAPIRIGACVNVQDGSILHTADRVPLDVGDEVSVGHRAVVHCRRVGPRTMIATGAVVLDDCEIGERCLVAAGSVLPPRTVVPDGRVVMGIPGRIVREVTDRDLEAIDTAVRNYRRLGRLHAAGHFPNIAAG